MSDPLDKSPLVENNNGAAVAPSVVGANSSPSDQPVKLTTEEQMALYEDYLKESDWGHQPC